MHTVIAVCCKVILIRAHPVAKRVREGVNLLPLHHCVVHGAVDSIQLCEGETIARHWLTSTINWTHQATEEEGRRREEKRGEEEGEEKRGEEGGEEKRGEEGGEEKRGERRREGRGRRGEERGEGGRGRREGGGEKGDKERGRGRKKKRGRGGVWEKD